MIQVKLGKIAETEKNLQSIPEMELPAQIAFRLARLAGQCLTELKQYHQTFNELLIRYGQDQGNGQFKITLEKMDEFNQEYEALRDVTIELSGDPISIKDFGDTTLKVGDLMALDYLIGD